MIPDRNNYKRLVILAIFFLPNLSFGQYEYGFLHESFFGRQPSARAEAIGRSYSSLDGDMTSIYYNPAGTATIKGFEVNGSYASPYYAITKAKYTFISMGCKIKDYLIIGISRNHFTFGEKVYMVDVIGNLISEYTPTNTNYTLTLSTQPIKNLLIGLNTNYFIWDIINNKSTTLYFDLGVIKKFHFLQKEASKHSVSIGASISNFNYSRITLKNNADISTYNLPVTTRYGTNYQFSFDKHTLIEELNTFRFILQGEYQKVFNSDYESAIRTGGEIMLFELLSVRAGYYKEYVNDYGFPDINKNKIGGITYGFGIHIPLYKLTKTPLNINFDYTNLPQPSYSKTYTDWDHFTTYNLQLSWVFQEKK